MSQWQATGIPVWRSLQSRLPFPKEIVPVYAVIAALVYGWTFGVFLWKLPSWLYFLTVGEILAIFCYAMAVSLGESLAILALLLAVSLALPPGAMSRDFAVRGTAAAACALGMILLGLARYAALGPRFLHVLIPWSLAGLLLTLVATYLAGRCRGMASAAIWISDRLIVFLYVFVPLSVVSVIVVIARNLL